MDITVLIKPASSLCNLHCSYCFYCDEISKKSNHNEKIMDETTVISIFRKLNEYCKEESEINFMFQGGEPLVAGIEYFRFFINEAKNKLSKKIHYNFSLQTNGTLLNDEFCRLFKEKNFYLGVSLDGPEELHNSHRNDSYSDVMAGISLLKRYDIPFSILSVITADTDAKTLFEFYKSNSFNDVQLIYCLDSLDGKTRENCLDPKSLARFKKRFFNNWFNDIEKGGNITVREFENLYSILEDGSFEQCGMNGICTPQLVIEADGTCYPCDFYCLDEYRCININESGLSDMLKSEGMRKFINFAEPKNDLCNQCEFSDICNGGCKRYRYLLNQIPGYCPQRDFLLHFKAKNLL